MKKQIGAILLSSAMIAACAAAFVACGDDNDGSDSKPKGNGFETTTVFHVDLTMSTAIGPLGTLCNPGTLTFNPDGTAKMNITFTDSAIVMMDTLLGFRIADFVDDDTYELNDDATVISYHSTRKSMSNPEELAFGDMEIPIEYLSDNSMKFTFDIGKAIPGTVLYFYSNEDMMPKPEEEEKVTVTYTDGTNTKEIETEVGSTITLPECTFASPDAKGFAYWTVGTSTLKKYPGDKITVKEDTTITANFTEFITLTFTAGVGTGDSFTRKIPAYSRFIAPECEFTAPESKGFSYWKLGTKSTKYYPGEAITSSNLTEDAEIVAQWDTYVTVSFELADGTGTLPQQFEVVKNAQFVIPECTIVAPEGAKASGNWCEKGKTTAVKPGDKKSVTANTVYTPFWNWKRTVSFVTGVDGSTVASMEGYESEKIILPAVGCTNGDKRFAGWSTSKTSTYGTLAGKEYTVARGENKNTLYAIWDDPVTLTFKGGDGVTGSTADLKAYERDKVKLPECGFQKEGYTFGGWKLSTDKTIRQPGYEYTVPQTEKIPEITAVWLHNVTVSFNAGDGATGTVAPITNGETLNITLPKNGFVKEGYLFAGWSDGENVYKEGGAYTLPAWEEGVTVTLTATWMKKSENAFADYTAVFHAGQTSAEVYKDAQGKSVTLNSFFPTGSLTRLVLRPDLTADFVIKSVLSQKDFDTHNEAGNLGLTYAEFQNIFNIEYTNIAYSYNKTTKVVTLTLAEGKTLDIQLTKAAKNDKIGFDNVQFEYALSRKFGAVEKLVFAALDGAPNYLAEPKVFTGKVMAFTITLNVNSDGTGLVKAAIYEFGFTHTFTADYKTIIWLGDEGDRLVGEVGRDGNGKMTVSLTMLGQTVVLTEQ